MSPEKINAQLALRPFRPFQVETTGGNRIRVIKPEWCLVVPDRGETVIFGESGEVYVIRLADLLDAIVVEGPIPAGPNGGLELG
jgi:hypothetical protein